MKKLTSIFLIVLLLFSMILSSCSLSLTTGNNSGTEYDAKDDNTSGKSTDDNPTGDDPTGDDPTGDDPELVSFEVKINEVCLKNTTNKAPNGDYYDWVELYNSGEEPLDLSGYILSDTQTKTKKYVFPQNTIMEAGSFLVVYCIGENELKTIQSFSGHKAPFKLSTDGETVFLFDSTGTLKTKLVVPQLSKDQSYGCLYDGSTSLATLSQTPGVTNVGSASSIELVFSHESGFYDEAFDLSVSAPEGYTICYTTDCSDPTTSTTRRTLSSNSTLPVTNLAQGAVISKSYFEKKITTENKSDTSSVDRATVYRFCVLDANNAVVSEPITKNYFVGYQEKTAYQDIPIICLTAESNSLYGTSGFMNHSADDGAEWQVNFTFFDEDGKYSFDQEVGIRARGTSTRNATQKNMNVYARSKYGLNKFSQALFPNVDFTKSVVLRSDYLSDLKPGEGFMADLASSRDIATSENYPVMVFVDGEFFGVYFLYERFSADYVEAHYGVDADDVQIVKKGGASNAESNDATALAEYKSLYSLMCGTLDNAKYQQICEKIDMQSLIDLLCVNMYLGNDDFSMAQNISCWRSKTIDESNPYADGKWRYVLYDLDYCIGIMTGGDKFKTGGAYAGKSSSVWVVDTFTAKQAFAGAGFLNWACINGSLITIDAFQTQFISTFMSVCNYDFEKTRAVAALQAQIDKLSPHMDPYIKLYNNVDSSGVERVSGVWASRQARYISFFEYRLNYIKQFLISDFNISSSETNLTIGTNYEGLKVVVSGAVVKIEDVQYTGTYFTNIPVTLEAKEKKGYTFDHWDLTGATITDGTTASKSITITIGASGATVRAMYKQK